MVSAMRPGFWRRLRLAILNWADQFLMILNLPTFTNDLRGRMRRLRRIYYANPAMTIEHGQVRDILHGHVDQRYRPYYGQLLAIERAIYQASRSLPAVLQADDLLYQTQLLGNRIVELVEELQISDKTIRQLRSPASIITHQLAKRRDIIRHYLEDALAVQATIPARLAALSARQEQRTTERLVDQIRRLNNYLEDVDASYAEGDAYTPSGVDLLNTAGAMNDQSSDF